MADFYERCNVLCGSIKGRESDLRAQHCILRTLAPARQQSAAMGSSPGQDPVFAFFPYSPSDVGATGSLLPAVPRWGYHSNQLFYSLLILCSFCRSRRHDYSIGQSLSAWGAWPAPGRSPGWLLCISHAQLVHRMAGSVRSAGEGETHSHRPRVGSNRSHMHHSWYKLTEIHASVQAARHSR